ncbi:hypothetical protein KEM52_001522 [Ascosphaera acerosa]|nr:hypothetical protein KEM52_001522 [Ascosphaera acerosa]
MPQHPKRVWTTLITNTEYLPGLLSLNHSLQRVGSRYPLVALYTDSFPPEGHAALDVRGILKERIPYLLPSMHKDYSNDTRFYDCWSKLAPFGLVQYDRVVQLDSDMLVLNNMDELMDLELDAPSLCGQGRLGVPNGGLQVVNPSKAAYAEILSRLQSPSAMAYEFADQSLLADSFPNRWVTLPYVYNALKTMRWAGVHDVVWQDDKIKNVHYILSPKPWEETDEQKQTRSDREEISAWWWRINAERIESEVKRYGRRPDAF